MKSRNVLLSVLAGAATGALLGILFAPEKGSRTRRKIMDKGEDYAEVLKDQFEDLIETIGSKYENTLKEAEKMLSKGKTVLNDTKKDLKETTV